MSIKDKKQIIGDNYKVICLLATGGMSEIYLAKTLELDKRVQKLVAIKKILPFYSSKSKFIQYFRREAQIAINMSHPNVVKTYKANIENDADLFLVVEYIRGRNIKEVVRKLRTVGKAKGIKKYENLECKLEIADVIYIIKEVARGLNFIHNYDLINKREGQKPVHRDISPQNIMLSWDGEVKILDFGISKAKQISQVDEDGHADETTSIKGKFSYMSPEQTRGKKLDYRTDIFSLGVVMWELLSNGKRLFYRSNEMRTIQNILKCEVPPLREINKLVPKEIDNLIKKMITKKYEDRADAFEIYETLNEFLNTNYPKFNPERLGKKLKIIFEDKYLQESRRDKRAILDKSVKQQQQQPLVAKKSKHKPFFYGLREEHQNNRSILPQKNIEDIASKYHSLAKKVSFTGSGSLTIGNETDISDSYRSIKKARARRKQKRKFLESINLWKSAVAIIVFVVFLVVLKQIWFVVPQFDKFNKNKAEASRIWM